jgi:glutathione S-transferase
MITLFCFGPAFGLPDSSPFVTKLDVLLKMSGLPYRVDTGGFRRAPKGKLPFIEDDASVVADSTLARLHLEERYGIDFDAGLTPSERGVAWAVEKLLEDNLYWPLLQARWIDDSNFERGPAAIFADTAPDVRNLLVTMLRTRYSRALWAQGTGRHSSAETDQMARRSIQAVAHILGDRPYLTGTRRCGADATLFAFVLGMLCPRFECSIRTAAGSHSNLVAYRDRLAREFYPTFDFESAAPACS